MERPSWSSIPAARSSLPVLRIRLWIVLGLLGLCSTLGLASTLAWVLDEPPVVDFTLSRPRAQGHALAIANSWLSGRATSLPVASGIDPGFNEQISGGLYENVRSLSPMRWTRTTVTGADVETHYILVDGTVRDFIVVVPFVFVSPSPGKPAVPVLAAYPSLLPADPVVSVDPLEYQNVELLDEDGPSFEVRERLEQWGRAYAVSDGASLRDLADDTVAVPEQYQGLGGMTLIAAPEVRATVDTVNGLVLRVRFLFVPDSAPAGFTMDLDLLVTAADSTKPRIVAWGPPGSGPSLEAYSNRR